jgi:hypothetical protein
MHNEDRPWHTYESLFSCNKIEFRKADDYSLVQSDGYSVSHISDADDEDLTRSVHKNRSWRLSTDAFFCFMGHCMFHLYCSIPFYWCQLSVHVKFCFVHLWLPSYSCRQTYRIIFLVISRHGQSGIALDDPLLPECVWQPCYPFFGAKTGEHGADFSTLLLQCFCDELWW